MENRDLRTFADRVSADATIRARTPTMESVTSLMGVMGLLPATTAPTAPTAGLWCARTSWSKAGYSLFSSEQYKRDGLAPDHIFCHNVMLGLCD